MLLAISGPLTLNLFIPVAAKVAEFFDTSYQNVQWSLTLYLLAFSAGQLIYGPLSDRWGRKPVLFLGLAVYALGSLLASGADTIAELLWGRFIQGLGICVGVVISQTLIVSLFGKNKAQSLLGYVLTAISISAALGPLLGGLLESHWGWRSIFYATTFLAFILIANTYFFIPDTGAGHAGQSFKVIAQSYGSAMRSRVFWNFILASALFSGIFFGFLSGAPFVLHTYLSADSVEYGAYYTIVAAGAMLGGMCMGKFSANMKSRNWLLVGALLGATGIFILFVVVSLGYLSLLTFFLPMAIFALGRALMMPPLTTEAIRMLPEASGSVSGLLGFTQLVTGALFSQLVAWLVQFPIIWFGGFMLAAASAGLCCSLLVIRKLPSE